MHFAALSIVLAVGIAPISASAQLRVGHILLLNGAMQLLQIDPETGATELVSGCLGTQCNQTRGAGPMWDIETAGEPREVTVLLDGTILLAAFCNPGSGFEWCLFKIDPFTGDRTIFLTNADVKAQDPTFTGLANGLAFVLRPLPLAVVTLPAWGVVLLVGVLIGVSVKAIRPGRSAGALRR